jgi:hypothetical protein
MVTPASSFPSSSSLRIASSTWRGMMRDFLLSLAAFPASSRTWSPLQEPTNQQRGSQATLQHINEQGIHIGRAEDVTRYLSGEVLEDSGEVDRSAGADTLCVAANLEVAANTADGELESGLHGPRHRLLPGTAGLPPGRALLHLAASSGTGGVHGRCCEASWDEVEALVERNADCSVIWNGRRRRVFERREEGRWWARQSVCSGRRAVGS